MARVLPGRGNKDRLFPLPEGVICFEINHHQSFEIRVNFMVLASILTCILGHQAFHKSPVSGTTPCSCKEQSFAVGT